MNGYIGMMFQYVDSAKHELVNNALALRYVPKGETGHTIERIRKEIIDEITELAELVCKVRRSCMFAVH